jgi:two-component system nitrogen regulation sensor histidine kinase NtrY
MTRELKHQRDALVTANEQLLERRHFMEAVLSGVSAGVIGLDSQDRITLVSRAAGNLLGLAESDVVGKKLKDIIPAFGVIADKDDEHSLKGRSLEEVTLTVGDEERTFAVMVTRERDSGGDVGSVVTFDDVTDLVVAQRTAAWADVARRIAHEIKNPLTPIQLSAQRLRRRFGPRLRDEGTVFDDCTRTIIQEVETLKTLVNEFATFARMPAAPHVLQDVHPMIDEAVVLFREAHPDVRFSVTRGPDVPDVEIDRSGMKRALVNVLDNAVAAVQALPADEPRHIDVTTSHDRDFGVLRIEISDNGPGVAADVRDRVFEPYVSTKTEGTGLGLAIVSAILADHKGFVRLRENLPRGSRFVLEIPVRSVTTPQLGRGSQRAYGTA